MKYAFIRNHQRHYPVLHLCEVLGVPPGSYYAWRNRPVCGRTRGNAVLDVHIQAVFAEHKGRYGSPRIAEELRHGHGKTCGDNRVAARMRVLVLGLQAKGKRKYKATTHANHTLPVAPNLLEQRFEAEVPNQK